MTLLTMGNSDLRRDRIWTWSLPAWVTTLSNGRKFNVCPSAHACAKLCYARKGTYRFKNVRAKHVSNLERVLDDMNQWTADMLDELAHRRFDGAYVRVHDGGDFFSEQYLRAWLTIMRARPKTEFYAYTKEVDLFKRVVEPDPPSNFRWIYSYGGRWDHLIEDDDRQADVFPTVEALEAAGFHDQEASDLLAITGPKKVGIVVNNHPGAVRAMNDMSFAAIQTSGGPKEKK
jgi:hypothetical protein